MAVQCLFITRRFVPVCFFTGSSRIEGFDGHCGEKFYKTVCFSYSLENVSVNHSARTTQYRNFYNLVLLCDCWSYYFIGHTTSFLGNLYKSVFFIYIILSVYAYVYLKVLLRNLPLAIRCLLLKLS